MMSGISYCVAMHQTLFDSNFKYLQRTISKYEKLLRDGISTSKATDVLDHSENGNKRWSDLHTRVGEHVRAL